MKFTLKLSSNLFLWDSNAPDFHSPMFSEKVMKLEKQKVMNILLAFMVIPESCTSTMLIHTGILYFLLIDYSQEISDEKISTQEISDEKKIQ